jgi:hypothetical protein
MRNAQFGANFHAGLCMTCVAARGIISSSSSGGNLRRSSTNHARPATLDDSLPRRDYQRWKARDIFAGVAVWSFHIITCTLNSEPYVAECIASVREQNYPQVERVFIDGGSTDGMLERIKALDGDVKILENVRGGIASRD